jgi:hypothetical protein
MTSLSRQYGALRKALVLILLVLPTLPCAPELWAGPVPSNDSEAAEIIARMTTAYAKIEAYQTEIESRQYKKGKFLDAKRFILTFKKPNQLRIDMESPKPGTILIYPDEYGKVTLQLGGWSSFVKLHLAPDSSLLASGAGQRIDQSDFGLLIRNIRHSLTDHKRGEISLSKADGRVIIEVLADDHFLAGVQTRYRFVIDQARWLPLEVHESTASGLPKRNMSFRNLKTPITLKEDFFRLAAKVPGS